MSTSIHVGFPFKARKADHSPCEKVYFARRLPTHPSPELVLPIHKQMTPQDVEALYVEKTLDRGSFVYNGPWLFKDRTQLHRDNLPDNFQALDALKMVYKKITRSTVLVATITTKSFGTLAEIGFAASVGRIAVYVFPDPTLTEEEIKDFWFIFQTAASTSHLWKEAHFTCDPPMMPIQTTLKAYEDYVASIKAPFLKRT